MAKTNSNTFKDKFLKNELWIEGYKAFHFLMRKPLGRLYLVDAEPQVYRLNRKRCCPRCDISKESIAACDYFVKKNCDALLEETVNDLPRFIQCPHSQQCCLIPLLFKKKLYGFIALCNLSVKKDSHLLQTISTFHCFVKSIFENIFKEEEIEAIYENLHPRALAMSTMHTVHRIISSSLHINDLLPRLGRFTLQVVKADYSAIFLIDDKKKFLVKRFETGEIKQKGIIRQKRIRVDTGIYGKLATEGNFHYSKRVIAVPLIEDDVMGMIVTICHKKKKTFSKVDLEILRTVSEQAVIAIKNAQLFEHHEKIAKGSVESISTIIDLNTHEEQTEYAEIFDKLVVELGREMHLSATEQRNVLLAAKLLNTGHLGIPEYIRAKKEPLSQKEANIIKKHPFRAVEVIKSIDSLTPIVPIILYHHELYDGSGYPHGLKGEEIPLTVRIISLVMSFVAIISERPYRSAKYCNDAINEIVSLSGTHFDPQIVTIFVKIVKRREIKKLLKETLTRGEINGSKKTKIRNKN
ncbi:HD-GYP domain-containing protein [Candidatus Omnitrophota bacterium]